MCDVCSAKQQQQGGTEALEGGAHRCTVYQSILIHTEAELLLYITDGLKRNETGNNRLTHSGRIRVKPAGEIPP